MASEEERRQWLLRVLGLDLPLGASVGAAADAEPLAVWRDAKEAVDGKLEQLARELRGFGDPDLERIADFGLFGLTEGESVALNKALFDYQRAAPAARVGAAGNVRKAVGAYRAALDAEPMVGLLDRNPFGVDIGVRRTLGGALDAIERGLG